jgi:hypothetical protein
MKILTPSASSDCLLSNEEDLPVVVKREPEPEAVENHPLIRAALKASDAPLGGGGQCPLCNVHVDNLDGHLAKDHPGGRPYQCETCVKGFSSRVALVNHLASAHALACPACGLSFSHKDNLARHMVAADHFPPVKSSNMWEVRTSVNLVRLDF